VSVSPNFITIEEGYPKQQTVEGVLRRNTDILLNNLQKELELELERLLAKWHARKLEQIFIEERIYKKIEEETSYKAVLAVVRKGLEPFSNEIQRKITKEDIERLLEIKIRRISRYDINKQLKELQKIEKDINITKKHLKDMVGFTINYIQKLLDKFGRDYPRKSKLQTLGEIDARAAALSNLSLVYQKENGFLGCKLKVENQLKDKMVHCSEYDRILLIFKNGSYKVISVPEKLFVGSDLYWIGIVNPKQVFNMIYRNGLENLTYVKRFKTPKFILNREYTLFEPHKRSSILFLETGESDIRARLSLVPSSRAKYNSIEIDFDEFMIKGAAAKGKRASNRVVRSVRTLTGTPKKEKEGVLDLPGFESLPKKE
jgi:topoisomerase-4 subunit A